MVDEEAPAHAKAGESKASAPRIRPRAVPGAACQGSSQQEAWGCLKVSPKLPQEPLQSSRPPVQDPGALIELKIRKGMPRRWWGLAADPEPQGRPVSLIFSAPNPPSHASRYFDAEAHLSQ